MSMSQIYYYYCYYCHIFIFLKCLYIPMLMCSKAANQTNKSHDVILCNRFYDIVVHIEVNLLYMNLHKLGHITG